MITGGTTPEPMAVPTGPGEHFAPITINIEYSLRNPADGLNFVLPSDAYPHVSILVLLYGAC